MVVHLVFTCFATLLFILGCDDSKVQDENGAHKPSDESFDMEESSSRFDETHFDGMVALSPVISTVGIVEWSAKDISIDYAFIEFGPDTNYQWTVPVDLDEPNFRTLLLGMKPNSTYHFRIKAVENEVIHYSADYTIETGAVPIELPHKTLDIKNNAHLGNEFITACMFNGEWAFILDKDWDYVWWYRFENEKTQSKDCVRARMDSEGKHMIIANGNVPGPTNGVLYKISMDGLHKESFNVPKRHHDVEVLPDGTITYFEYENSGKGTCDRILEMAPDGSTREILRLRDHFGHLATDAEWCHSNAINYIPSDNTYTLSILQMNSIIKFTREGEIIWVFGGVDSDFSGASWFAQHQHQLKQDSILLFNNNGSYTDGFISASRVVEYALDQSRFEAHKIWEYSNGVFSMAMGDVKRLSNSNILITFSPNGIIQEVSPEGRLLRDIRWGLGDAIGYVALRSSLYASVYGGVKPEHNSTED
jgi:hypothetical protein